ncbi:hypothetical protein ACLOJK_034835 [Asimina triloba]
MGIFVTWPIYYHYICPNLMDNKAADGLLLWPDLDNRDGGSPFAIEICKQGRWSALAIDAAVWIFVAHLDQWDEYTEKNGAGWLREDGGQLIAHLGCDRGRTWVPAAAIWPSQIGVDEENDPGRFGFAAICILGGSVRLELMEMEMALGDLGICLLVTGSAR